MLIFMLIVFYNYHDSILLGNSTLEKIYCFDDWVAQMLRVSSLAEVYNFHLWAIKFADTERGKKMLL